MNIGALLSIFAGLLIFYSYFPYIKDVYKGKVKPARSARIMLFIVLLLALLQQKDLGSGYTLAITIGEIIGSLAILFVSIKHGLGGMGKLDMVCYGLLGVSIAVWLTTNNTLLALHLTLLVDLIAFTPTLVKTWFKPDTETAFFYVIGVIAPVLNVIAAGNYEYGIILFPLYLAAINGAEIILIYRNKFRL